MAWRGARLRSVFCFEVKHMAMLTVSAGGVPVGNYTGTFAGVEATPANKEKDYGPGLRWKWTVETGQYAGQVVSRVTTPTPSPKNSAGKILSGCSAAP